MTLPADFIVGPITARHVCQQVEQYGRGFFDPTEVAVDGCPRWVCVSATLLDLLAELRARTGPIVVTSGTRDPYANAELGGAADSMHLYGLAADIVCTDFTYTPRLLANVAADIGFSGIGVYTRHVHVDVRDVIGRDPARWGFDQAELSL